MTFAAACQDLTSSLTSVRSRTGRMICCPPVTRDPLSLVTPFSLRVQDADHRRCADNLTAADHFLSIIKRHPGNTRLLSFKSGRPTCSAPLT